VSGAEQFRERSKRNLDAFIANNKRMDEFYTAMRDPNEVGAELAALGAIVDAGRKFVAELLDRVTDLETRLVEVEKRGVEYRGVWQRAEVTYRRGSIVTCDAALWIGVVDNPTGKPGDSADWQLAIPAVRR
jgi:hypothetical protein